MATEQQTYEMLVRIDHPVFPKDLTQVTTKNSPFNSIMNRLVARQFVRLQAAIASLSLNAFPNTCDEHTIDRWEETYFGFTKPSKLLQDRIDELLIKINSRIRMSVGDVIKTARAITGLTPIVIRNFYYGGWVLDESILDVSTILSGGDATNDSAFYIVIFTEPVDSFLLKKLDEALTKIEKAGSRHYLQSPIKFWILDSSVTDVDTVLG